MASSHAVVQVLVLGALMFLNVPQAAATARSLKAGGVAEFIEGQEDAAFQPLLSITSENEVQEEEVALSASNSGFVANGRNFYSCNGALACHNEVDLNFYSEATGYKGKLHFSFFLGFDVNKCSDDGVWCVQTRQWEGSHGSGQAQFKYGGRTSDWVTLHGKPDCWKIPGGKGEGPKIKQCDTVFSDAFFNF